jgi:hypothetical protein
LYAYKNLKDRQKQYSESTKSKIEGRRKNIPKRGGAMPKGKKPIKHIRRG